MTTLREEIEQFLRYKLVSPLQGNDDDLEKPVTDYILKLFDKMIDEKLSDENAKVSYDYGFALQMLKEELKK